MAHPRSASVAVISVIHPATSPWRRAWAAKQVIACFYIELAVDGGIDNALASLDVAH